MSESATDRHQDELYIGYLPTAPPGIARRVRGAVILLLALTVAVALTLVFGQQGFSAAVYEYLVLRDFQGVVGEAPYPTLAVRRPGGSPGGGQMGQTGGAGDTSRFYLVGPGKAGAAGEVEGLDGQHVELRGTLLYRDDQTMVEVEPDSVKKASGSPVGGSPEGGPVSGAGDLAGEVSHGVHTLAGTIIDSKCYLGIMKPGFGKPHKACAIRCIAGGVPPVLVVRDADGPAAYLLLVGADGRAVNQEVLDRVDEPLEITGEVIQLDDLWILKAEPADYRRLL